MRPRHPKRRFPAAPGERRAPWGAWHEAAGERTLGVRRASPPAPRGQARAAPPTPRTALVCPPLSPFSAGGRQPPAPCLSAPQAAPPRLPPVYLGAGPGGCGSPRALTSLPSARCPPLRSGPWRAARPEGSRDAAGASCPLCRPDRTGTGMGTGRGTGTGLPSTARSRPGSALPGR